MIDKRIREAREKRGWTQAELARRMGLSEAYGHTQVSNWESGRRSIAVASLSRAAVELGVSVDWLLGTAAEPD